MARGVGGLLGRKSKQIREFERWLREHYPELVLDEFIKNTPQDSGYAKRHTKLKRTPDTIEIVATDRYKNYAEVLDKGLFPKNPKKGTGKTTGGFSTQAPQGMSKPTERYANKILKRYLRRIK